MNGITVADIMTRAPIIVKPETNLLECSKKMVRKKVGSLLLVEDKNLKGIITYRDILWALIKKSKSDLKEIKAIDISPKKTISIKPDILVSQAIKKMNKYKFERLPVIQNKKLIGMITVKDVLNFHPEFYPELEEFASIREESRKLNRLKKAKRLIDGVCEECGSPGMLHRVHGVLVCESCKNSI